MQDHPVDQFEEWFEQALDVEVRDPSGMTLATADANGQPSGRIVLLKGYDRDGFVFYTNYGSRKAEEMEENPQAALVFWWAELDRQVRIQGRVERTDVGQSQAYFATRPRGSQISGMVSPQSRVVESRQWLEDAVAKATEEVADRDIPCPTNWGGYRLNPHYFEFWQGRPNRLHDRIVYRLSDGSGWIVERPLGARRWMVLIRWPRTTAIF